MKMPLSLFCLTLLCTTYAQDHYTPEQLKDGKFKKDSSHIYTLPFEENKKVFLIQGYKSKFFSHKGEIALDFKVKTGTKICAARKGIVVLLKEDSNEGGLKQANLSDGNFIAIRHEDGSTAWYCHFKQNGVLVNIGDTIQTGQVIGLSGNTGYSAFPHLHFEVQGADTNNNYTQLPTRFYTNAGVIYLRPGKFYRTIRP